MTATTESATPSFNSIITLENLSPEDIPRFIGKKALSIKHNIKVPTWKMFTQWQKKEKIQDDQKHSLFIRVFAEESNVQCEIKTSSDELHKFAVFMTKKSASNFNTRVFRHTYYASMDHSLIPLFIGQNGKSIQTFLSRAVNEYSDGETCPFQPGNPFSPENRKLGDLRLSVNTLDYFNEESDDLEETVKKLTEEVESSKFIDIVGWQPSAEEYEPFIKIEISVFTTLSNLDDIKVYFSEKLNDYIGFIEKKHEKRTSQRENFHSDIDLALNEM